MNANQYRMIAQGFKPAKVGFVQSRGVGDVIIAMPILKWYYNKGHEVHLVVDQQYVGSLSYAFPYVKFHGVYDEEKNLVGNISNPYWYETPKKILEDAGCEEVISFPYEEVKFASQLEGDLKKRVEGRFESQAVGKNLTYHLNFDQFKYAVAGVPFEEKWNLDIRRNLGREYDLFNKVIKNPACYMVCHTNVNNGTINVKVDDFAPFKAMYGENLQVIEITKLTDNIFDWLTVLERATCTLAIDSSYVNLIDQLGFKNDKYFIQRSDVTFTPVLREKWEHVRGVQ